MICVPERQLKVHRRTEALSVFVMAPLMLWAATRKRELTKLEKGSLAVMALGAVAVDGWLLSRWRRLPACRVAGSRAL